MTVNQINQLIQYFFSLTETHLKNEYGNQHGASISNKFQEHFNRLLSANENFMPDNISRRHGVNPIFIMALFEAQREFGIPEAKLSNQVLTIYRTMLQPLYETQKTTISLSKNPWNVFLNYAKAGNRNLYENDYFKLKNVNENSKSYGFDITNCLYFDIFKANNHQDLAPILCKYDYIMADAFKEFVRFERKETIAEGYSRCDFRYYKVPE